MPITSTGWCLADGNTRAVAARLLQQVEMGRSMSGLLDSGLTGFPSRDASLVKEFCFGVTRYWPQLDAIAGHLVKRPLKRRDADIRALILLGLYQLRYMRVAPHAALAETVDAARTLKKPWAAGLINALLRRFQREQDDLMALVEAEPAARYACPSWLLQVLQQSWPGDWQSIVAAFVQRPPFSLRVNLARISRSDYFERLQLASIPARPIPGVSSGLVLDQALDVGMLPGFAEGLVSVQDGGAQLAAGLLDPQPGQQLLDACAAPGGKTGHLLEMAPEGVRLTAVDLDPQRLGRIEENLQRLSLSAEVCQGDAARPRGEWSERRYDRILLDVPCSATGVIRRHPDIKLLRRPGDIRSLARTQVEILESIWPLLKPGGRMLYATCSLLPEENERQLERFMRSHDDAREWPIEASWGRVRNPGRQILPGEATMDGFYYAMLAKA